MCIIFVHSLYCAAATAMLNSLCHTAATARLKLRWAASRLAEDSDLMLADMDAERSEIDDLFAELDVELAASRQVGPAAAAATSRSGP